MRLVHGLSPADTSVLRDGDEVIALNGQEMTNALQLNIALGSSGRSSPGRNFLHPEGAARWTNAAAYPADRAPTALDQDNRGLGLAALSRFSPDWIDCFLAQAG